MKNTKTPIISAIVAMTENRVIGKDNQMPWHLPADLQHFKALTTGHPIVMGRKTYASIGRPLPNRTNIILTRDKTFAAPGCIVVSSIDEAIQHTLELEAKEIFIIGGADIYKQLLPIVDRIYLTLIHQIIDGDTFFPELDVNEWQEKAREKHAPDEKNAYFYSFLTLERQ